MANGRLGKFSRIMDKETAILSAAREVFVENGYDAANIADIARRANVADGTIYTYFANKKELLHRVLAEFVANLATDVENQTQQIPNTFDRLRYLISRHLTVLTTESELCLLFFREAQVSNNETVVMDRMVGKRYTSVLLRIIKEGMENGELRNDIPPTVIRSIIFGGLEHLVFRTWSGDMPLDIAAATDNLMQVLISGLAPQKTATQAFDPVLNKLNGLVDRLEKTSHKINSNTLPL